MANSSRDPLSLDVELDIFGQNPKLSRLYTQLCFCFALPDTSADAQDVLVGFLSLALERLCANFPWIAGQVIEDDEHVFRIWPWQEEEKKKTGRKTAQQQLSVCDLRDQMPSMDELRHAEFPFSMLDEKILAPRGTLPERFEEPAPVFLLQANFVHGGLLLLMMGQHNCMDMAGQSHVMELFSRACRGDAFSSDELRIGNAPRRNIITRPVFEMPSKTARKPPLPSSTAPTQMPTPPTSPAIWAYVTFSALDIFELKTLATSSKTQPFISTDDAVNALLWQAMTRARFPRLQQQLPAAGVLPSTFHRQVDVRRHVRLPATYPGMAVATVSTTCDSLDELLAAPVGRVASWLRSALEPNEVARAAALARSGSRRRVVRAERMPGAPGTTSFSPSSSSSSTSPPSSSSRSTVAPTDVKMSSWAKESCCEFDFGSLLGRAEAVRRPRFEAWEGLAYVLPRARWGNGGKGDLVAAVCLCEEDMRRFQLDEAMADFARFVG